MTTDKLISTTVVFLVFLIGIVTCQNDDAGFFWHVTDMHWDPTYDNTTAALSCGPDTEDGDFGDYGDYRCDSPWKLVVSAVNAMKQIYPNPDFLIWTGDDTPHIYNDTILNKMVVKDIIFDLTDLLNNTFPAFQVFPALGNHDWSPKHQLPPHGDPFYEEIAAKWSPWIQDAEANKTFNEGGYFMKLTPDSRLRMVILNTNLYYENNKLTSDLDDPAGQFAWLDTVLQEAADKGEKVIMLGHVPPGQFEKHRSKNWFYPKFNKRFQEVVTKHASSIGSMHFAHHHTDSFRLFYNNSVPVSSMLIAPAVTPWETTLPDVIGGAGNNPAIRLVKYNKTSGAIMNVLQYYLNLTEANRADLADWKLFYNATEYYGQADMGTQALDNLAGKMQEDDELFDRYYLANGVGFEPGFVCRNECRLVQYCAVTKVDYDDFEGCLPPNPGPSAALSVHSVSIVLTLLTAMVALMLA